MQYNPVLFPGFLFSADNAERRGGRDGRVDSWRNGDVWGLFEVDVDVVFLLERLMEWT